MQAQLHHYQNVEKQVNKYQNSKRILDPFNSESSPGVSDTYTMAILAVIYAVLCGLVALSSAHNIQLKAHSRECFHEQLHADDRMTVTFQVGDREFGGSGNLDVDFWVCSSCYCCPAHDQTRVSCSRHHDSGEASSTCKTISRHTSIRITG